MISDQEFLEIVQGLYQKTVKENLKWQATPVSPLSAIAQAAGRGLNEMEKDAYCIQIPQAAVILHYGNPRSEPDFIVFTLSRNLAGPILATRKVYEGDLGWEQLSNLYALIKRRAMGWDDVFQNVRKYLGDPTTAAAP